MPDSPRPAVVMYHGCGSSPEKFEMESQMNVATSARRWFNIYPKGTTTATSLGWNAGSSKCSTGGLVNDVDFSRAVLLDILEQLCVDHTRIFAGGFSNGGSMVFNLTCEIPQFYRAFGFNGMVPSSTTYPGEHGLPAKPIFGFCGSDDGICSGGMSTWFSRYAADAQCSGAVRSVHETATTECHYRDSCHVNYCMINGLGHCWPGNDCCDSRCTNQNPANIDASAALLRFWDTLPPDTSFANSSTYLAALKAQ